VDPWEGAEEIDDQRWLRRPGASLAREALQQSMLFPLCRAIARPRVFGAGDLVHAPQPAVIAPSHGSDIDTPLVLDALPRSWRSRTVVGAASDRFYRGRLIAVTTTLWINTFPFDRGSELRGLGQAAELLREGYNVLLYPQGTRSSSMEGFRTGVARLCVKTGAPLLPVYVGGTALIMPKDRGLISRGKATVAFGSALEPEPEERPEDFLDRLVEAVTELRAGAERR